MNEQATEKGEYGRCGIIGPEGVRCEMDAGHLAPHRDFPTDPSVPETRWQCGVTALACYDCGLLYASPGWCDCKIPDDVWRKISPTGNEGGVLCISCIAARLVASGIDRVPLLVTSGPWDWAGGGVSTSPGKATP